MKKATLLLLLLTIFVSPFSLAVHLYHKQVKSNERRESELQCITTEDESVLLKLNSLTKCNKNAVLLLLDSLHKQEVHNLQKKFTVLK